MATGYAPPGSAQWTQLPPPKQNPDGTVTLPNGRVTLPGATINADGSVTAPNGNPDGTITFRSDGSVASQSGRGLTTMYDATGKAIGTTKADGTPASPGDVEAANNANAGPLGGGGILGLGAGVGGVLNTTIHAVGGVTPGGAILGYAPSGSPSAMAGDALGIGGGSGGAGGGNVDTSPISAAAAASKALSDKFLADYNAAHPGEPPVATAAQLPPAVLAAMPPAIKAGIAAQGSPVVAGHADASLIDPSTGLQFRQGQEGLINTLNDAISGKAPSVAALQLEQTRANNAANQLGFAAKASGGGNAFLALQNAANQTGQINAKAGSDAAILRAKEIMDARGQLGSVLDQARGGDITIGKTNAELGTDVSKTNATNTTNANSETARLANSIATTNANNETGANVATGNIVRDILQGNRDAANNTNLTQGKLTNDVNLQNTKNVIDQRTIDEKTKADLAANSLTGAGQNVTGAVGAAQAAATAAAAKAQADAAKLGAGATVLATLLKGGH